MLAAQKPALKRALPNPLGSKPVTELTKPKPVTERELAHETATLPDEHPAFRASAAGEYFSILLDSKGRVFTNGACVDGRLGQGHEDQSLVREEQPLMFSAGGAIVCVAAGKKHAVAVTADGRAYTWGQGKFGQLGLGDGLNRLSPTLVDLPGARIVHAAAGEWHTLFVDAEGRAYSCGRNGHGQLGLGDTGSSASTRRSCACARRSFRQPEAAST